MAIFLTVIREAGRRGTHKANPLASGEGSNEAKDMSGLDSGRSEVH